MHKIYARVIKTEFIQFYVLNKFMSSCLVSSLQKKQKKNKEHDRSPNFLKRLNTAGADLGVSLKLCNYEGVHKHEQRPFLLSPL